MNPRSNALERHVRLTHAYWDDDFYPDELHLCLASNETPSEEPLPDNVYSFGK